MLRDGLLKPPDPITGIFVQRYLEFHYEYGAMKDDVEPMERFARSIKDLSDLLANIAQTYGLETDAEDRLIPFFRKDQNAYPIRLGDLQDYISVGAVFDVKNCSYRKTFRKADELCIWMKDEKYPLIAEPVFGMIFNRYGSSFVGDSRYSLPSFSLWFRIPHGQVYHLARFLRRHRDSIEQYLLPESCDIYRALGSPEELSALLNYSNTPL